MFNATAVAIADLIRSVRRISLNCRADLQLYLNLTLPIRFAFARDRADYYVACDEEACSHYGEAPSTIWRLFLAAKGFIDGLTTQNIPQWFIDSWFRESSDSSMSVEITRPSR